MEPTRHMQLLHLKQLLLQQHAVWQCQSVFYQLHLVQLQSVFLVTVPSITTLTIMLNKELVMRFRAETYSVQ